MTNENFTYTNFIISKEQTSVIKGIAICAMLWHHIFAFAPEHVTFSQSYITLSLAHLGKVCVSIFLLISGYGLATQYDNSTRNIEHRRDMVIETCKFLGKRFIKFYTNYWFIFLVFVPLGVFCFDRSLLIAYGNEQPLILSLLLDILGLQWGNSYNATWWFNSLIICLYITFPILFFFCKKLPLSIFIGTLLLIPFGDDIHIAYRGLNRWFFPFCVGIIWAIHSKSINRYLNRIKRIQWFIILTILTLTFSYIRLHDGTPFLYKSAMDSLLSLTISLFIVSFQTNIHKISQALSILGRHSATIYMTHTFIFSYWFSTFIYWFHYPIIIFSVLIVICLALSIILEYLKGKSQYSRLVEYLIKIIDKK